MHEDSTPAPKETLKDKAKRLRREAYQKAKAARKARGPSPAEAARKEARKERARAARKEAYQKAKARKRELTGKGPLPPAEPKASPEELMATLTTADQLEQPPEARERPKLRLVRNDEAPS